MDEVEDQGEYHRGHALDAESKLRKVQLERNPTAWLSGQSFAGRGELNKD